MAEQPERPHRVDWLKVVAGALAAVSSALLLSTLGAAGTIVGAALGSVIVSLTTSFYSSGLDASRRRMAEAQTLAMRRVGIAQAEVRRAGRRTEAADAHLDHADDELAAAKEDLADAEPGEPTLKERLAVMPWKQAGLFAAGFFLCAVIAITAFELIAGKPVSSLTGGTEGGGTSFSRFDHGTRRSTPSPSPSVEVSPSASTAASSTPTAPDSSPAASPTESQPTASPTEEPSAPPSDDASPDAAATP